MGTTTTTTANSESKSVSESKSELEPESESEPITRIRVRIRSIYIHIHVRNTYMALFATKFIGRLVYVSGNYSEIIFNVRNFVFKCKDNKTKVFCFYAVEKSRVQKMFILTASLSSFEENLKLQY